MSVDLATLVTRLQGDVPARSDVPTSAQYEQAVRDAVIDYSGRRPLEKVTTLSLVSGQAEYALPDDFLFLIKMSGLWYPGGVIHSTDGLIAVPRGHEEGYTIAGLTLTFQPTPSYATTRELRYAAGHILDESDAYPALTLADAAILLHKAAAICLRHQARAVAIGGEMIEYQIGDERVKRSSVTDKLNAAADTAEAEYLTALRHAIGPAGLRATYSLTGA